MVVGFTNSSYTPDEDVGTAFTVTVRKQGNADRPISVALSLGGGNATRKYGNVHNLARVMM